MPRLPASRRSTRRSTRSSCAISTGRAPPPMPPTRRLARGERQPLLGLPMTVKEQFNVAGLPTTWGDPKFKDWQPEADALGRCSGSRRPARSSSARPTCRSTLGDWQSYNEVYGTTNNPWDLARTPGGSSGGVGGGARRRLRAAGARLGHRRLAALRRRISAACSPTSRASTWCRSAAPARRRRRPIPVRGDLAVIGPMARSAADLALELAVVAGPDELTEGIGYKLALPPPRHDKLADFRVLVIDTHPLCPTAASISAALDGLADRLAKLGCRSCAPARNCPTWRARHADLRRAAVGLLQRRSVARRPAARRGRARKALSPDDQSLAAARLRGLTMSHAEWIRTSRIRGGLRARWQALFEDVDVVLCPPMPTVGLPARPLAATWARQLDIDGRKVSYDDQIAWAGIATSNGLPATTMPIGTQRRRPADRRADHRRLSR